MMVTIARLLVGFLILLDLQLVCLVCAYVRTNIDGACFGNADEASSNNPVM
jgi:hypothetical protein